MVIMVAVIMGMMWVLLHLLSASPILDFGFSRQLAAINVAVTRCMMGVFLHILSDIFIYITFFWVF